MMTEFVGKFLNKIDKKGRVSVPALWRPKLLGEGFSGIVAQLTNGYNSVDGYSKNYLERYQDWLDKQDPIVYAEYMNTTYGADFCKNANEYRAVPQVELEIDGADGPSKYQTDIHKHIADKYEMSKDKKTKVIVKVIDPISKKEIDYDNNLQYKIQKVTNGFPEEYDRGEFEVKDGLGEFEFNTPKTKSHLFLKVKPPKGAMDEDGVCKSWHPDKYICLLVIK